MAKSVNQQLVEWVVRHGIDVERFKNYEIAQIAAFLKDELLPDVLKSISKLSKFDLLPAEQRKAYKLLQDIVDEKIKEVSADFMDDMKAFARTESTMSIKSMDRITPAQVKFNTPGLSQLNAIVTAQPFEGKFFKEWFSDLSVSFTDSIMGEVRKGLTIGETIPQLAQRVVGTAPADFADGVFAKQMRQAETIVRTTVNHVSSATRQATFDENSDLIKGVRYVATLDARTSLICAGLDGKVYPLDEGPRPPMHPNCRSQIVPVLKSAAELGLNLKEMSDTQRASMNGLVSAKQTFGSWLRDQDAAIQRDVLGKTRYELFSRGLVPIEGFANDKGIVYSLDTLLKREGISRDEVFSLAA